MKVDANTLAEDLARTLSGEKDGVNIEKLKADMRACADYYGCSPVERREMWGLALRDQVAAAESYDRTAALVLGPFRYINERIQDNIALERAAGFTDEFRSVEGSGAAYTEALAARKARRK